jgi:hypothetical protein
MPYEIVGEFPYIKKLKILDEIPTAAVIKYDDGVKAVKFGEEATFFDTWDEAMAELMKRARNRMGNARLEVEFAKAHLLNIKGLKEEKAND